jgi:peroxiredoxin
LPDDLADHFGVILFYRGSWCPYCNTKLSAFQHAPDCLADIGALVAAVPVDDEATTQDLVDRHGLRIPVGHSARCPRHRSRVGSRIEGATSRAPRPSLGRHRS